MPSVDRLKLGDVAFASGRKTPFLPADVDDRVGRHDEDVLLDARP